jgi:hypothetical protein
MRMLGKVSATRFTNAEQKERMSELAKARRSKAVAAREAKRKAG